MIPLLRSFRAKPKSVWPWYENQHWLYVQCQQIYGLEQKFFVFCTRWWTIELYISLEKRKKTINNQQHEFFACVQNASSTWAIKLIFSSITNLELCIVHLKCRWAHSNFSSYRFLFIVFCWNYETFSYHQHVSGESEKKDENCSKRLFFLSVCEQSFSLFWLLNRPKLWRASDIK